MKKHTSVLALLLLIGSATLLQSQTNLATNIVIRAGADKSRATITYDLPINDKVKCYKIQFFITMDGEGVKSPVGLVGDIGPCVYGGPGKRVVWVVKKDVTTGLGKDLKVLVNATPVERCDPKPKFPVYAALGGVAVVGAGSIFVGLKNWGDSKSMYQDYKTYVNPNDIFYKDVSSSRTNLYKEANKKYKTGQIFTYAGAGIAAAGGYFLVRRLMKIKKHNAKCAALELTQTDFPDFKLEPMVTGSSVGFGLSYKF